MGIKIEQEEMYFWNILFVLCTRCGNVGDYVIDDPDTKHFVPYLSPTTRRDDRESSNMILAVAIKKSNSEFKCWNRNGNMRLDASNLICE